MLSACTTEGGPKPDPATPAPTASDEVLRLAYPSEPPTLDPIATGGGSAATRDILRPVLPALFRLDERLQPQPELAAGWPSAEDITGVGEPGDPLTVTLRLREALWSDGKAITSADVRFSWMKLRVGPTKYRYRFLRDVQTPTPQTVRFVFERPVRRWWALFSIDDMVLPEHAYSAEWKDGPTVSGGPFAFQEWTSGLRVRLVRNERYRETVPLKGIDVLFVSNDETRLQLLDRGEVDLVFSEGESNMGRRAAAYGFANDLEGSTSSAWGPTWWELDIDPSKTGSPVARAVLQAASTDLVAEILEGLGSPMNAIPADFTAEADGPQPWAARQGLDAARKALGGSRRGFQLGYATGGALAAFLHFRLVDIGVTVELVGVEADTFEATVVPKATTAATLRLRRGADAPDAAAYENHGVGDQLVAAETTGASLTDQTRGLDAVGWLAAQRALVERASVIPLARVRTFLIGADGVAGPLAVGAANGPMWNTESWTITR